MIRAIIDTNCLLASISPRSAAYELYRAFTAQRFEWVVSNEILTEYDELLTRTYSASTARLVLEILTLAPNTIFQEAYYRWQLIEADPDDNKFADVAIAAGVTALVTNDGHFDVLGKIDFPSVRVVSLSRFLEMLR